MTARLIYDAAADNHVRTVTPARYELFLPFPPSVNAIWRWVKRGRTGRTVARSEEYSTWLKDCDGWVLDQLGVPAYRPMIRGRYTLTVTLCITRWKTCDQDNCLKALSDLLQRSRLVADDKNAWVTMVSWGMVPNSQKDVPLCRCEINEI